MEISHLSFEFFPPRTEEEFRNLTRSADRLQQENPDFFSVTYGAGGSTKDRTYQTVQRLRNLGRTTFPHLSWGDSAEPTMLEQVSDYLKLGIEGMVVLRGDLPSGAVGQLSHSAKELVALIRQHFGDKLQLFVGCYPEVHPDADTMRNDLRFLKDKVDAGATACITQYFYNVDAYIRFVDECRRIGITQAIIPGIMPLYNYHVLVKFSQNCGADIPRWIERRMYEYREDKPSLEAFGVDVVSRLCTRLIEAGAPGLHFYTLNRALSVKKILKNLATSTESSHEKAEKN